MICYWVQVMDPEFVPRASDVLLLEMAQQTGVPEPAAPGTKDYRNAWTDVLEEQCVDRSVPDSSIAKVIEDGVWFIGDDFPGGTYTTVLPAGGSCYWSLYRAGTNQQNIIASDSVSGGYPTVRVTRGQEFQTDGCGLWAKNAEHPKLASMGDGIWLVGRDIEPGRYKVTKRIRSNDDEYCTWVIYRGRSNADDIEAIDSVQGGRPEVVLRNGQEFSSRDCGTWRKR